MWGASFFTATIAISLLSTGLLETSQAAHSHHHGDVMGRLMHKPKIGSNDTSTLEDHPHHEQDLFVSLAGPTASLFCSSAACGAIETGLSLGKGHDLELATIHKDQTWYKERGGVTDNVTRRRSWSTPPGSHHQETAVPNPKQRDAYGNVGSATTSLDPGDHSTSTGIKAPHLIPSLVPRQDDSYQSFVLQPVPQPASTSSAPVAAPSSVCPAGNGTNFSSSANVQYQILCNIDFFNNDYPFQLVGSFDACVQKCDDYNNDHGAVECLAALFVPSREEDANDCYLKSSTANPVNSNLGIQGAIRLSGVSATQLSVTPTSAVPMSASPSSSQNSSSTTAGSQNDVSSSAAPADPPSTSSPGGSSAGVTYASGNSVISPKVSGSHLQGPTMNTPSKQYIDVLEPPVIQLADSLLTTGVNGDLTTGYELSPQTGVLNVNITTQSFLRPLSQTPHLSRDGGRGGMVNGQHLFVFCDTGSYSSTTATTNGNFLGFVSSSCAVDVGMNGLSGTPLNLQDGIGEWSDDTGRQRGFAPLTEGELAYNLAKQGNGQRYAVWPESSIIPLDSQTGILYAPVVYDNVNRATQSTVFTYTGATLLTISAGGKGGPAAERTVDKLFDQDEIEWGCSGGIRSWGPSGIGGDDGQLYVFGNIAGGVLAGRTTPGQMADRDSYEYWDGTSWTSSMPTSSSKAFWIQGQLMDIDVFYSPRHLTFIIVYMNIYADSTFYFRYLEADQGILPPFAPGGDSESDYVENIFKYSWSEEQVLYKASPGLSGKYIYSGGVHQGYYGSNDITNGGTRMLISWTAPTGQDPSSLISEYQIITAEIDWA